MLTWFDVDRYNIWRQFDKMLETMYETPTRSKPFGNLRDLGEYFVLDVPVPGMKAEDLNLSLENDTLKLSGERKIEVPEGYTAHRQERASFNFSRSYSLPSKVSDEGIEAKVVNGILSVKLPKASDSLRKQISVS